jgi:branched-chain amino acid transport system permease protein
MDFVNLAHGVQYVVGAYLAAMFASLTGGFWGALALTLPTALAFGLAIEFLVFRWLYGRDHLSPFAGQGRSLRQNRPCRPLASALTH